MKQSKKTAKLAKPVRKNNKKIHRYFKNLSKRRSKATLKLAKSVRKNNKKIRKYFNRTSKKHTKKTTRVTKSVNKKSDKNKKHRRFNGYLNIFFKQLLFTGRLLMLSTLIIGASFGLVYAERVSSPKTSTISSSKPVIKQTTEAPTPTTSVGPAQSNSQFAMYPSWAQNFANQSSGTINQNDWEINQGPAQNSNNEAEYYTDNSANLRIANGSLVLEATHQSEPEGYNYGSARIDTDNKVSFLYGRIDITAELPAGTGTWPAAWLLPANNKYEDLSPASDTTRYYNGGEIDLVEAVGFQPNVEYGIVHTLSDLNNPGGVGSFNTVVVPSNNTTYNTYTLLWTPTSITFEVNNVPFYSYDRQLNADYTTWPFDQPFYLILNLAIGGSWGAEDTSTFPSGIDNSILPASMNIRSIYYYPYVGSMALNN